MTPSPYMWKTLIESRKQTLLIVVFSVCLTSIFFHFALRHDPQAQAPGELYEVVQSQLNAFRESNYPTAYSQASTHFRQTWSLDQFVGMMKNEGGRILKAERVEFGPWQRTHRQAVIQVFFISADGSVSPCVYTLVSEGDRWKIDNARWVKPGALPQRMRGIKG